MLGDIKLRQIAGKLNDRTRAESRQRVVTLNDRTGTQRDLKSVEMRVKSHCYLLGISGKS